MPVEQILTILTPLVVFGATKLVRLVLPKVSGAVIVGAIVPLLSAAAALLGQLLVPGSSWLEQFAIGLVAVFVNELIKQLKQPRQAPKQ